MGGYRAAAYTQPLPYQWRSGEIITAIHMNELAIQMPGLIRSQKHNNIGDLFWLSQAAGWKPLRQLGQLRFCLP
jgi:hypothetical protein